MLEKLLTLFVFQFVILILLNKLAYKFKFLDYPSKRKIHSKPIPYVGGLALSFGYSVIIYLIKIEYSFINLILLCGILISIIGLIDDKFDINPFSKLLLQSIPVYILLSEGLILKDIGNYEIIGKIYLGNYGLIFTFLCCLLIINAFNYMDGIDGLLSSLFLNIFFSFTIICFVFHEIYLSQIFIYLMIPVIIFFLFNITFFNLPKIFLGDSGSTLLGFITGFTMIFLYTQLNIDALILVWPVALIIYDFLSTSIIRIFRKKNIFTSGNDHIHYQISKRLKLKVLKLNMTMNLINYSFTILGIVIYYFLGSFFSLIAFILMFFLYLVFKIYFFR